MKKLIWKLVALFTVIMVYNVTFDLLTCGLLDKGTFGWFVGSFVTMIFTALVCKQHYIGQVVPNGRCAVHGEVQLTKGFHVRKFFFLNLMKLACLFMGCVCEIDFNKYEKKPVKIDNEHR